MLNTLGTTSTVCDGIFCINPMTGGIYLSGELVSIWQWDINDDCYMPVSFLQDRETQDLYILQAAVSNNLNLTFNVRIIDSRCS